MANTPDEALAAQATIAAGVGVSQALATEKRHVVSVGTVRKRVCVEETHRRIIEQLPKTMKYLASN